MPFAFSDAAIDAAAAACTRALACALANAAKYTAASATDGVTTEPSLPSAVRDHRQALLDHEAIKAVGRIVAALGASGHRLPDSKFHPMSFGGELCWAPGDPIAACPLGFTLFIADAAHRKGVQSSADGLVNATGVPQLFEGTDAAEFLEALHSMFDRPPSPRRVSEGVYALRLDPELASRLRTQIVAAVDGNPELCWTRQNALHPHLEPSSVARTAMSGKMVLAPDPTHEGGYLPGICGGWDSPLPALSSELNADFCSILDALRLCPADAEITDIAHRH
eukprot:gene2883-10225_t